MKKISGVLMIIFLATSLICAVPSIITSYANTENSSFTNLTNGQWSNLFETEFAEYLPPRQINLSLWGITELLLFKEGREGVLIGNNGWLFTDEEFTADKNRNDIIQDNKNYILETSEKLQSNNTQLIISLIPAKARIMQDQLGKYNYPDYNHSFYGDMLTFFSSNEIHSPDLYDALAKHDDIFFKADTHWTPKGSMLAAKAIGTYATNNKIFEGNSSYIYNNEKTEEFDGDLTTYIPVRDLKKYGINKQTSTFQTISKNNQEPNTNSENSLFGDQNIPIALVGTSYSANARWNFENHLKYYLQSDIYNAADEGLGPFATMRNYLESDEYKNAPAKLLIWEIPERYISIPETE